MSTMNPYVDDVDGPDDGYPASHLISNCCGAPSLGDVLEDAYGHLTGICSECRDHATFEKDTEDESPS